MHCLPLHCPGDNEAKVLLKASHSHSNFPLVIMNLVQMAATGHTFAAQEPSLTYLFLRNLKFLLKKPIVIATVSHSCFTHVFTFISLLPQAIILLHLCRIESAAIPISEEKAMEWVAPPSRSLKASSKEASFPLFLKMP